MKVFAITLGLLLAFVAVIWAVGFFALGYGLQDVGSGLAALGRAVLYAPVNLWHWFKPLFGVGLAGGFLAMLLTVGCLAVWRSHELGLLFTGAALALTVPAFAVADAPLAGATWRLVGLYAAGWGVALVLLVVLFAGLNAYNAVMDRRRRYG